MKAEGGGYTSYLCARFLAWIKVLGLPPVMPSVFIVWVKQLSRVSEFNSLSVCVVSHLLFLYYLVSLFSLIALLLAFSVFVSIDPLVFPHRHLPPVSSHSTEGKPGWGRPLCRGATPRPVRHSYPTKSRSPTDSTAPSSQATDRP